MAVIGWDAWTDDIGGLGAIAL